MKCPHCRSNQPAPALPYAIGLLLAVALIIVICSGILNPPPHTGSDSSTNGYDSVGTTPDPRDERWNTVGGREVIRAMAEEAGVSEEEMRQSVNDELDRRGLSNWADGRE